MRVFISPFGQSLMYFFATVTWPFPKLRLVSFNYFPVIRSIDSPPPLHLAKRHSHLMKEKKNYQSEKTKSQVTMINFYVQHTHTQTLYCLHFVFLHRQSKTSPFTLLIGLLCVSDW
uniref:Uncharacterized protein n=1 Tax=Daphnia magna TaxID=35525 RepID=A0A0P5W5X4_9CRUS